MRDILRKMIRIDEVPCRGGLENAVRRAVQSSGKDLPLEAAVLSTGGRVLA